MKYTSVGKEESRIMIGCEVGLGKMYQAYQINNKITSPPFGYDSIQGVGSTEELSTPFLDNEFVIYNQSQYHFKYLFHFQLPSASSLSLSSALVCSLPSFSLPSSLSSLPSFLPPFHPLFPPFHPLFPPFHPLFPPLPSFPPSSFLASSLSSPFPLPPFHPLFPPFFPPFLSSILSFLPFLAPSPVFALVFRILFYYYLLSSYFFLFTIPAYISSYLYFPLSLKDKGKN